MGDRIDEKKQKESNRWGDIQGIELMDKHKADGKNVKT